MEVAVVGEWAFVAFRTYLVLDFEIEIGGAFTVVVAGCCCQKCFACWVGSAGLG